MTYNEYFILGHFDAVTVKTATSTTNTRLLLLFSFLWIPRIVSVSGWRGEREDASARRSCQQQYEYTTSTQVGHFACLPGVDILDT